jgi:hypothetical protein
MEQLFYLGAIILSGAIWEACSRLRMSPSSLLENAPLQIHSLFKLLSYPHLAGNAQGDGMELGLLQPPARGRTFVDVGLHKCETVVEAVKSGYLVHGFEPLASHMAYCHRALPPGSWFDVPIVRDLPGRMPRAAIELRPHPPRARRGASGSPSLGFAYLYQAALGSVARMVNFTSASGFSSVTGQGFYPRMRTKSAGELPMLRLDSVILRDVWLLKLDAQGYASQWGSNPRLPACHCPEGRADSSRQ